MKRKSLIEAVSSPEARDFIQAGTPKSQFVETDSKEQAVEAKEEGEAMPPGLLETKAVEQRSEAEQPAKKRMPKQVTGNPNRGGGIAAPDTCSADIPTSSAASQRIWRVRR